MIGMLFLKGTSFVSRVRRGGSRNMVPFRSLILLTNLFAVSYRQVPVSMGTRRSCCNSFSFRVLIPGIQRTSVLWRAVLYVASFGIPPSYLVLVVAHAD